MESHEIIDLMLDAHDKWEHSGYTDDDWFLSFIKHSDELLRKVDWLALSDIQQLLELRSPHSPFVTTANFGQLAIVLENNPLHMKTSPRWRVVMTRW